MKLRPDQARALGIAPPEMSPQMQAIHDRHAAAARETVRGRFAELAAQGNARMSRGAAVPKPHPKLASPGKEAERRAKAESGRRAREAGEDDEALILDAARDAGLVLRKMPTPIRRIGPARGNGGKVDGSFTAVYDAKAGCDFRGTLPGGRSLVFEAKASGTASLPLERPEGKGRRRPTLTDEQRAELSREHALGAVAGVLVRVRPAAGDAWVWCPWPAWLAAEATARAEGRASLSVEVMEAAGGIRCPMAGAVPRWPEVVARAAGEV